MLVLRLQRTGRENTPSYRIVVAEKARPVKGKFKEIIGHYLPARKPDVIEFDKERVEFWIKSGAIPSDTLARLFAKHGLKNMEKFMKRYAKQRSKSAPPEETAAPVAAAPAPEAAPVVEAPPTPEAASAVEAAPAGDSTPENA